MIKQLLTKTIISRLTNHKKFKIIKVKKKQAKRENQKQMIKLHGKTRYFMTWLFGSWAFHIYNNRTYTMPVDAPTEKLYQKFYSDEKIAARYADRLTKKYNDVEITNVFGEDSKQIGYMLNGKEKIV